MNNLERLEEDLLKEGVEIDWYPVKGDGYINLDEPSEPYIAVNPDLPMRKKTAVAYHEVGHLRMGLEATNGKNEIRAQEWAANQLIDTRQLVKAVIRGVRSLCELSDYLDVDEDLLKSYFERMAMRFEYFEVDGYVLTFHPVTVQDKRTGRIWPEGV